MSKESEKILIVEDDESVLSALSRMLEFHGMRVEQARDGQEALEFLKNCDQNVLPEAIVLDLMMPRMDGRTFLETIERDYPSFASIPILVTTALGRDQTSDLPLSPEVVLKPMSGKVLVNAVKRVLNNAPT